MKRLQRYYYLVGTPILLLVLGTVAFFDLIVTTVRGNPHPQINYVIFVLFIFGSVLMMLHVWRINREGALVDDFVRQLKTKTPVEVGKWLELAQGKGRFEVYDLLREVLDVRGRVVGPVEHAAIEAEVARFQAQQQRRLLLAQYLAGVMVGMGLFGTFIGLLGALKEISEMIGGFVITGTTDPVQAIGNLVGRLVAPMKSMGVAFSASLFGVLGSMFIGVLLVFVKGAAAELVSLVHSRISWLLDLSKATGETASSSGNTQSVKDALGELAQHSPLLNGLVLALDQSERRVRQLVDLHTTLAVNLQQVPQALQQTAEQAQQQSQAQQQLQAAVEQLNQTQRQLLAAHERGESRQQEWGSMFAQQQQLLQSVVSRDQPWSDALQELTRGQSAQVQQLQAQWERGLAALVEQLHAERNQWQAQAQAQAHDRQQTSEALLAAMGRMGVEQAGIASHWTQKLEQQAAQNSALTETQRQMAALVTLALEQLQADSRQRLEQAELSRQALVEMQQRQEQMFHALLSKKT